MAVRNDKDLLPIILGTAQFGQQYGITNNHVPIHIEEAKKITSYARQNGIHLYDTSQAYGDSETVLGAALSPQDRIITKLYLDPDSNVESVLLKSLASLKRDSLETVLVHNADVLLAPGGANLWAALEKLKAQGRFEKIGISVYEPQTAIALQDRFDIDVIQHPFNIFDQRLLEYREILAAKNIEIHARSLFLQGALLVPPELIPHCLMDYKDTLQKFSAWSADHNMDLLQMCLAFAKVSLAQGYVDKWVIGVAAPDELSHFMETWNNLPAYVVETLADEMKDFAIGDSPLIDPRRWVSDEKTKTKSVAIIPARGGSKRLPRKNILPLHGSPMLGWPVKACLESGLFDEVIVSTDDDEIATIATQQGARVIMRPAELATDEANESLAYVHVLETLKAEGNLPDYFCGIYATAALITAEHLQGAYKKMRESEADVLMGVSSYGIHPYKALEAGADGYLKMVYPEWCLQRSQFYPHYVASNGTFYFFRVDPFIKTPTYYPDKLVGYEIPAERAIDIDTEEDYRWAKTIMANIFIWEN